MHQSNLMRKLTLTTYRKSHTIYSDRLKHIATIEKLTSHQKEKKNEVIETNKVLLSIDAIKEISLHKKQHDNLYFGSTYYLVLNLSAALSEI